MTLTFCGVPSHALLLALAIPYAVLNPGNLTAPGLAFSAFARHY
jgi:hypothetical protein